MEDAGCISSFRSYPQSPSISHLLFADAYLLVCRARLDACSAMRDVLQVYCAISGQSVNLSKSSVHLSLSIHKRHGRLLAKCLGMKWVGDPWKYLRVPITGKRLKKCDFRELLAKIQGRLGSWRTDTLSIVWRAILIQTVLQAMPLYLMTNTRVLIAILDEIEVICRKFLGHSLALILAFI